MPGNTGKTRRAVLILHPDFEQPGKAGILEAKQFADQFIKSQRELIKAALDTQSPDIAKEMQKHVQNLNVIVRNIPEEVL